MTPMAYGGTVHVRDLVKLVIGKTPCSPVIAGDKAVTLKNLKQRRRKAVHDFLQT